MTHLRHLATLSTVVAALAIAGCGDDDKSGSDSSSSSAQTGTMSSGSSATIAAADAGDLGKVVVDADGRTLYLFEKDEGGKSACSGACATQWPPAIADGKPSAGDGLDDSKLGTTKRSDGDTQVTYGGHPLYRFNGDSKPGDTNGQEQDAFGAEWYAVSPDGEAVEDEGEEEGSDDSGSSDDDSGGSGGGDGY